MTKCKDFAPRITDRGPFGGASDYESFSDVVNAVNQWIEHTTIQLLNVETIVLPDRIEGTSDGTYGVTVSDIHSIEDDSHPDRLRQRSRRNY